MYQHPQFNRSYIKGIDCKITDQISSQDRCLEPTESNSFNSPKFYGESNEKSQNLSPNEIENPYLLFLRMISPLNSICFKNVNPKFLDSMLKLIDKYQVPFNLLKSKKDGDDLMQEQSENDETKKTDDKKKTSYKKFSEEEDNLLRSIVGIFGAKNWRLISSMIPNKTPRQCRDRYMNYLAPGFIHSEWTKEEDEFLAQKYIELGPQWSKIQKYFPFRTANSIKNRYKYTVCRIKPTSISKKENANDITYENSNSPKDESKIENVLDQFNENINNDNLDCGFQDYFFESYENISNDYNYLNI